MKTAFKWLIAIFSIIFCIVMFIAVRYLTKPPSEEKNESVAKIIPYKHYEENKIYIYHLSFEKKDEIQVINTFGHHFHQDAGKYISCFNWKTGNSLWMDNKNTQSIWMSEQAQIKRICNHTEPHRIYIWSKADICNHEKH